VVVFASLALRGYLLTYFNEPVSPELVGYRPLKIPFTEELDQRLTVTKERIMTITAAQQAVERGEELAKLIADLKEQESHRAIQVREA
jgi:hypothetical protein